MQPTSNDTLFREILEGLLSGEAKRREGASNRVAQLGFANDAVIERLATLEASDATPYVRDAARRALRVVQPNYQRPASLQIQSSLIERREAKEKNSPVRKAARIGTIIAIAIWIFYAAYSFTRPISPQQATASALFGALPLVCGVFLVVSFLAWLVIVFVRGLRANN